VIMPARKGHAQINENALRDVANRDVHDGTTQAEQLRELGNERPGVYGIEQHLKDGVEGDQAGGVFGIALGQFVPHDHHGDAARQADHNESRHVLGIAAQKYDG
jgi:hypothetical protein